MSLLIKKILQKIKELDKKTQDSGWQNLQFMNSWHNNSSQNPAQYRKVGKTVYLRGLVYNGGNPNRNVAQLPDGYFPTNLVSNLYFITRISGSIQSNPSVQITKQGVLTAPSNMTDGQWFELDGISFLVN